MCKKILYRYNECFGIFWGEIRWELENIKYGKGNSGELIILLRVIIEYLLVSSINWICSRVVVELALCRQAVEGVISRKKESKTLEVAVVLDRDNSEEVGNRVKFGICLKRWRDYCSWRGDLSLVVEVQVWVICIADVLFYFFPTE